MSEGDEAAVRMERARAMGLLGYRLIREAADPELSTKAAAGWCAQSLRVSTSIRPGGW